MEESTETGWLSGLVGCDLCAFEWIAVWHTSCEHLECPNCENMSQFEVKELFVS